MTVAFYDYQKAYDVVRHDWVMRVYSWMGVPERVLQMINEIMKGWKTRPEVKDDEKIKVSEWINIRKEFLQGDSYSPAGFQGLK